MAATLNDCYATPDDVCALIGRTSSFDTTTVPTLQMMLDELQRRSARCTAVMRKAGQTYTVPAGGNSFGDSPTGLAYDLKALCAAAAAAGGAAFAFNSNQVGDTTVVGEKVTYFETLFSDYLSAIEAASSSTVTVDPTQATLISSVSGTTEVDRPSTDW